MRFVFKLTLIALAFAGLAPVAGIAQPLDDPIPLEDSVPLEDPATPESPPRDDLLPPDEALVPRGPAEPANELGYFGAITDDRQAIEGVRIMEVMPEGPAADAGLETGDLVTSINGTPIRRMDDFAAVMQASKAGDRLTLKYQRGGTLNRPGQPAQTIVTLGTRPAVEERPFDFGRIGGADDLSPPAKPRSSGGLLGLRMGIFDAAVGRRLQIPATRGVLVTSVNPGSPADRAGIARDAVIVSINGQAVAAPDELARAISNAGSGATIELDLYQAGKLAKKRVVLGDSGRAVAEPPGKPPAAGPPGPRPSLEQQVELLQKQVLDLHWRLRAVEEKLKQAEGR